MPKNNWPTLINTNERCYRIARYNHFYRKSRTQGSKVEIVDSARRPVAETQGNPTIARSQSSESAISSLNSKKERAVAIADTFIKENTFAAELISAYELLQFSEEPSKKTERVYLPEVIKILKDHGFDENTYKKELPFNVKFNLALKNSYEEQSSSELVSFKRLFLETIENALLNIKFKKYFAEYKTVISIAVENLTDKFLVACENPYQKNKDNFIIANKKLRFLTNLLISANKLQILNTKDIDATVVSYYNDIIKIVAFALDENIKPQKLSNYSSSNCFYSYELQLHVKNIIRSLVDFSFNQISDDNLTSCISQMNVHSKNIIQCIETYADIQHKDNKELYRIINIFKEKYNDLFNKDVTDN